MKKDSLKIFLILVLTLTLSFFAGLNFLFCDVGGFRLPFVGSGTINLGSPYHIGTSSEALDFGLAYGQELYAAGDGEVIRASYGWNDGYGNLVKIRHNNGYISMYAHLSNIAVFVGDDVKIGQFIGNVGNTGEVWPEPTSVNPQEGKHLHFEIRNTYNQSIDITGLSWINGSQAYGPFIEEKIETIDISSKNRSGEKFVAPQTGRYRITLIGGAYTAWSEEHERNWKESGIGNKFEGWKTKVSIYINKAGEFGIETEFGRSASNENTTIGSWIFKPTYSEAEAAGRGSNIVLSLNQNDYIILIVPDSYYLDNRGTIKIRIDIIK